MGHFRQKPPIGHVLCTFEVCLYATGEKPALTVLVSTRFAEEPHEQVWPLTGGCPTAGQIVDVAAYIEEFVYKEIVTQIGVQEVLMEE